LNKQQPKVSIIAIPLSYFVIIPKIIQDTLNRTPLDSLTLSNLDIANFTSKQIGFHLKAQLPPPTILPFFAEIGDFTLRVHDDSKEENRLLDAQVPGFGFKLNDPVFLDMRGNMSFQESDMAALKGLVERFSRNELKDTTFMARSEVVVRMFGITWYGALPIYKELPVPTIANDLVSVFKALPNFARIPPAEMSKCISFISISFSFPPLPFPLCLLIRYVSKKKKKMFRPSFFFIFIFLFLFFVFFFQTRSSKTNTKTPLNLSTPLSTRAFSLSWPSNPSTSP
jgi:hypothetical protein